MDRDAALAELPEPYAVAIRLDDAEEDEAVIAVAVGVEREAVPALLEVARAKLERVVSGADH